MSFETLEFDKRGEIGVLTLSRPRALNALNHQLLEELGRFLDQIPSDLRCLVLQGAGEKAFVAGADITEMKDHKENEAREMALKGQALFSKIENLPIPVIASVQGFALGGGLELALACDFIVAGERARMGLPEVSLGLIPGYGGTQRLARVVGKNWARMMVLTGEVITAEQAHAMGLVVEVVSQENLLERSLHWAEKVSTRSGTAVALAKKAINEGFDVSLAEGLGLEASYFATAFTTKDSQEGIAAFLEKRPPQFTGVTP